MIVCYPIILGCGFVEYICAAFYFIFQGVIMNTNFLTVIEIASILKISKALAYRLIANGEIPSIRFGRTVRVKTEALDEFIEKNSSTSISQSSPENPSPQANLSGILAKVAQT
jgi:excisionase family DNA binding protein